MIHVVELHRYLNNIQSSKDFHLFIDLIKSQNLFFGNVKVTDKLFHKIEQQINQVKHKYIKLEGLSLFFKLTLFEWIYIKQKSNYVFEGYICYKRYQYAFKISSEDFLKNLNESTFSLLPSQIREILTMAINHNSKEISKKLSIEQKKITKVIKEYKVDIDTKIKEIFIDLIINNHECKEICKKLHISENKFQEYFTLYAQEIHNNITSKKNSKLYDYYNNGNVKLICPFKNGLINGKVIQFYENGKTKKEIEFINGKICGLVKDYDIEGKLRHSTKIHYIAKLFEKNITENENNVQYKNKITSEINPEENLYINALYLCWEVLEFIPDKYKTEENCLIAFEQNCNAIKYFPNKYRSEKICNIALKKDFRTFKEIPNKFKTQKLSEDFITRYPKELKYIPEIYRTKNICEKALTNNYKSFKYVPDNIKTEEMCKKIVALDGLYIQYVPNNFLTEELCLSAVIQNWEAIKFLQPNFKNNNTIQATAIKQDYHAISYIDIANEIELCNFMVLNKDLFSHIPQQKMTQTICDIALKTNLENIQYIPIKFLTINVCNYFLKNIKNALLPYDFKKEWVEKIEKMYDIKQILSDKDKQESSSNKITSTSKQISNKVENVEDILNSKKYLNTTDLLKVENSKDKIFNLSLIKQQFVNTYPDYANKITNINKSSSNIKIKTKYKNIYYIWSFRGSSLEIILEFDSSNIELFKYFNSFELELKKCFENNLIVGQTKSKNLVYISTNKYNLNWAITNMYNFIIHIGNKLDEYYKEISTNTIIDNVIETEQVANNDGNKKENTPNDDIEYVNLNILDGKSTTVKLTRYERNPKNRTEAIKIHGTTCIACGFNFNEFYGEELAKDFIEIHHIKPLSKGEYIVNPKTDLVPLCSNCHSMIHKEKNPPKTIDEIRNRYKKI